MPRKKSPILGRAWDLIACSLIQIPRVRVRSRNLLLFRRTKRFHLLRHYSHGFIREYEFSPSGTPLFRHPWRAPAKKKRKRVLSLFLCGGNAAESSAESGWGNELEAPSVAGDQSELPEWEEDEVSVDRRAERFIQRFYEEMRIQRRRSLE